MFKVKNLDKTTQRIYSNGRAVYIEPGKTVLVEEAPGNLNIFHIEQAEEQLEEPKKLKIKGGK